MRRYAAALAMVVPLVMFTAHAAYYFMPFEDSYISFRYAENLSDGEGLVYNSGERVEGFTSFGWVVLLAVAAAAGAHLPDVACGLSFLFGACLVIATVLTARRWLAGVWGADNGNGGAGFAVEAGAMGAAALVASHGTLAYYAMTGMETTLFSLMICLGLLLASSSETRGTVLAALLFAGSAMVRPEGVGYAGLACVALLMTRQSRRSGVIFGVLFLAVFTPYFLWRWQYFGYPLPNTYYAKASPSWELYAIGMSHLEQFASLHMFWVVIPAFAALATRWRERWVRLAFLTVAGAACNVVMVGGDVFAFYRFVLPMMPAGYVVVAAALVLIGRYSYRRWGSNRPLVSCLAPALILVVLSVWTWAGEFVPRRTLTSDSDQSNFRRVQAVSRLNDDYFEVGRWLKARLPADAVLAVNAAGIVPYVSGLTTIDMLGLTDEHIAHSSVPPGSGALGHEKHDAAYVLDRRPDVIIPGLPVLSKKPIGPELVGIWFGQWTEFIPGDGELLADPRLAELYDVASVPVSQGRWLTFFLLKQREAAP